MAATGNAKNVDNKEKNKEIDKLIAFLERFIVASKNGNKDDIQVDAKGHIAWKETLKEKVKEGSKESDAYHSEESEEEKESDSFAFYSILFEFKRDDFATLATVIESKLKKLRKNEEVNFNVNQRLFQGFYGHGRKSEYRILIEYLESLNGSFTSNYKKDLVKRDKNGKVTTKSGTSISIRIKINENDKSEEATFINLIDVKNALSKSRGKVIVDLSKEFKAQKISQNIFILSPDVFFCAILGDDLFVFNLPYFFYMFVPTPILMKEIEKRKSEMESSVVDSQNLIEYARKMPAHVRDLYFFIESGSKIPDKDTIMEDIQIMKRAGVSDDMLTLTSDNKINCTEANAALVLSYVSKKLGLRISDKRLVNVEASTNV
ncbi:MAG: hypothetical protein M1477_04800 [Candidatus Thermoplasmatota archaeon]|nr:hypothetical protein [Candidatus Thermoplasmatota archaeon]